jgi:uncharacterized membrane protein YccC
MSWFKRKPEKPLRQQLMDARDALIDQIAILQAGPAKSEPGAAEYMADQAATLRETLREIEEELAKFDG